METGRAETYVQTQTPIRHEEKKEKADAGRTRNVSHGSIFTCSIRSPVDAETGFLSRTLLTANHSPAVATGGISLHTTSLLHAILVLLTWLLHWHRPSHRPARIHAWRVESGGNRNRLNQSERGARWRNGQGTNLGTWTRVWEAQYAAPVSGTTVLVLDLLVSQRS